MSEGLGGQVGWFIRAAVRDSASIPVAATAFQDQHQALAIHKDVGVPPVSIADQSRKRRIQFGFLGKSFRSKTSLHDLQDEVIVRIPPEEEHHVGQSRPEAQLHPVPAVDGVLDLPPGPPLGRNLDVNVAARGEGEGRRRGAPLVVEAVRAQARVTLFPVRQPRVARGSVLARVAHAAAQLHAAVTAPPGELAGLRLGTVAAVGGPAVLAPGAVLAGLALALVNVHLTQIACRGTTTGGYFLLLHDSPSMLVALATDSKDVKRPEFFLEGSVISHQASLTLGTVDS